ncbi:MAG: hypothetical protein UR98_C0037G0001 [Parcubacteria group bacterium GW2011_GWA1_36_12]|nr:MAG: hypothetical protein UR98_C0037G0001 [Parcubacteria group bacterium GW2011_GWA1_36_12]
MAMTEERKNIKRAYLYVFLSIIGIVFLIFLGIPTLVKFAGFLGEIAKSDKPVEINDITPPAPPQFNELPEFTNNESINVSSHVCLVGYLWLNLDGDERCYKECPNGMRDCVNSTDSTCALVTPYENPQQTEQVCSSPAMDTILNK